MRRLTQEIARTTRQGNALENVVIPALEAEATQIAAVLDEREREEHSRLERARDRRAEQHRVEQHRVEQHRAEHTRPRPALTHPPRTTRQPPVASAPRTAWRTADDAERPTLDHHPGPGGPGSGPGPRAGHRRRPPRSYDRPRRHSSCADLVDAVLAAVLPEPSRRTEVQR